MPKYDDARIADDDIQNLTNQLANNTDIARAMIELFKDEMSKKSDKSDIDLRTRLYWRGVKGHSIIQFLQNITVDEVKGKDNKLISCADELNILSMSLKRHSVSYEGKSRHEIVELFKSDLANKQLSGASAMFMPQNNGR